MYPVAKKIHSDGVDMVGIAKYSLANFARVGNWLLFPFYHVKGSSLLSMYVFTPKYNDNSYSSLPSFVDWYLAFFFWVLHQSWPTNIFFLTGVSFCTFSLSLMILVPLRATYALSLFTLCIKQRSNLFALTSAKLIKRISLNLGSKRVYMLYINLIFLIINYLLSVESINPVTTCWLSSELGILLPWLSGTCVSLSSSHSSGSCVSSSSTMFCVAQSVWWHSTITNIFYSASIVAFEWFCQINISPNT